MTVDGTPITFHPNDPVGDTFSDAQLKLHTGRPGRRLVLVHDTAADGFDGFSQRAAKAAGAEGRSSGENAAFLPGSGSARSSSLRPATPMRALVFSRRWRHAARGGSIFRASFNGHGGRFRSPCWATQCLVVRQRDVRGHEHDPRHRRSRRHCCTQLNTLDSVWAFDVRGTHDPRRLIALGRDAVSETSGEDNEPTGLFVSEGSVRTTDVLGAHLNPQQARWFVTEQHGKNQVWEITH